MSVKQEILFSLKIAVVLSIAILVGLLFVNSHFAFASFWPAAGLTTSIYYIYKKKALGGIILSIFITVFIFRLLNSDETVFASFIITLVGLLGNMVEIFLFKKFVDKFNIDIRNLNILKEGIGFSLIAIVVSLAGALISSQAIFIFYGYDEVPLNIFRWTIGNFTGILIFGSLMFYSHYRDLEFNNSFSNVSKSLTYIIIYIIISYFVFAGFGNDFLTFENFQIAYFIMYIIAAFSFSYRMIIYNNLMFLASMAVLYVPYIPQDRFVNTMVIMSIYIITLSSIASMVKNILFERNNNYNELDLTKENLEKIIISTNNLFNIQDKLPEEAKEYNLKYLTDMFELACNIYTKFDRATCNLKEDKYVKFVGARGYDLNELNRLQFLSDKFIWTLNEPKIVKNTDYDKVFQTKNNKSVFIDDYGVLKESIRFTVVYGEDQYAGMSFDLFSESKQEFNEYDVENFKSFQHLMNSYYKVGILNSQKNNLKDGLVLSLVRTLSLYDSYTGGHSEEVANLSVELSKRLHLSTEEIRHVYWSGIVHDIGKIGLDDTILNKKGKLTDLEYEEVKKHSIYGYEVLSKIDDLKQVARTVRHHHEWWNGSGYPDKLRGIQIPYSSQILHVCDAVSAMAQDRVYKKALSEDEIIEQLSSGLGKQFSPKVAKFMIKLIQDGELKKFLVSH